MLYLPAASSYSLPFIKVEVTHLEKMGTNRKPNRPVTNYRRQRIDIESFSPSIT